MSLFRMAPKVFVTMMLTVGLTSLPARADDVMQVNMTGTVVLKSTSKSAIREGRPVALHDAAKKLWRFMQANPTFADKTKTFTSDQNDQVVAMLESECSVSDLDQDVDKTSYMLSWRFRFDCTTQKVTAYIAQLNGAKGPAGGGAMASSEPTNIMFLFFEQRDSESTQYEDKVHKVNESGVKNSSSDKLTNTLKVDNNVRAAAKTSESEVDGYGEKHGKASESVDRSASVKARVTVDNAATATSDRDTSSLTTNSLSSSGSTTRKATETKVKIAPAADFGEEFISYFSHYPTIQPLDYADIRECSANAPTREDVLKSLQSSEDLTLDSGVQRQVFAGVRECGVRLLIIGRVKVSLAAPDVTSGGFIDTVNVSAELRDLNKRPLPAKYNATAPNVKGQGSSDKEAIRWATRNSANQLGDNVLNTINEQGVR